MLKNFINILFEKVYILDFYNDNIDMIYKL